MRGIFDFFNFDPKKYLDMSENNIEFSMNTAGSHSFSCTVCGSPMYITDHGNHELTYHCSSSEARFWDFDRGTFEQVKSKEHWDRSKQEIFPDLKEDVKFVLKNEPPPTENKLSA